MPLLERTPFVLLALVHFNWQISSKNSTLLFFLTCLWQTLWGAKITCCLHFTKNKLVLVFYLFFWQMSMDANLEKTTVFTAPALPHHPTSVSATQALVDASAVTVSFTERYMIAICLGYSLICSTDSTTLTSFQNLWNCMIYNLYNYIILPPPPPSLLCHPKAVRFDAM